MGYVCYKLFLIVFRIPKLGGHVIQGCRQVSHLVLCVDRNLVVQISGGILFGGFGDQAQGPVDEELEGEQYDERKSVYDEKSDVYCAHHNGKDLIYVGSVFMYQKIPLGQIVLNDRGNYSDYIILEISMVVSGQIFRISSLCRVEFFDCSRCGRKIFCLCGGDDRPLPVNKPYSGI